MPLQPMLPGIDEAQLHRISLCGPPEWVAHYRSLLSSDELARADRFVFEDLRTRFTICRGVLRELLGSLSGQAPQDVRFRYEQWGKPQLATPAALQLHFNVSHSADHALIAIANTPLGVDLEVPQRRVNYRAIASQVLSPTEQPLWESLPAIARDEAIMQLWVCKEALLKALGLGIADGLRQVSFPLPIPRSTAFMPQHIDANLQLHLDDDGTCRTNSWIDAHTWSMRMLEAGQACFAALATTRTVQRVSLYEYSA